MQHQEYAQLEYETIYDRTLSEIQNKMYKLRKKALREPSHQSIKEYKDYRKKIKEVLDL